jgi:serine/threonine-protein kinase
LLFLLTGQTPHRGENALELMVRAAWTPAESARKLCPELPDALADVIDRCCAFEPDERFQSADELHQTLERLTGLPEAPLTLELTFTPTGTNTSQSSRVASSDQDTVAEAALGRTSAAASRRGWVLGGAGFGALALVSALVFAVTREQKLELDVVDTPALIGETQPAVLGPKTISVRGVERGDLTQSEVPAETAPPPTEAASATPSARRAASPRVSGAPGVASSQPPRAPASGSRTPRNPTSSEPKSKTSFPEKTTAVESPTPTSNLPKINYRDLRDDKSAGHQP